MKPYLLMFLLCCACCWISDCAPKTIQRYADTPARPSWNHSNDDSTTDTINTASFWLMIQTAINASNH